MLPCNCSFSFQSHPLICRASGNEGMEPILSNGMCKAFLFLDVWNREVIAIGTENLLNLLQLNQEFTRSTRYISYLPF